jgi:hypothetical protein
MDSQLVPLLGSAQPQYPKQGGNHDEGTTAEVASTGSGEHAAQDQAHGQLRSALTSATDQPQQPVAATTAAPAPPAAGSRVEVELTDAGTRLKLQGKLDEGTAITPSAWY